MRNGRNAELELGIVDLVEGLLLIDERKDPRVALSAFHNLALFLVNLELPILAREVLRRSRELYERSDDPTMHARRLWLEGSVAARLGEEAAALDKLQAAAFEFYSCGEQNEIDQINAEIVRVRQRLVRRAPTDE